MKKMHTKSGLIAYKTTTEEIQRIGGIGICDECGKASFEGGYLIPVLNHWQCPDCFDEWQQRAKYYPEDEPIEARNASYYEAMIPTTEEISQGGGAPEC